MSVPRIGPKRLRRRLFLAEWREAKGLTQKQLGARLGDNGVADVTVSRWERSTSSAQTRSAALPNTNVLDAIAEALGIEPDDLWHHPAERRADHLVRGLPPEAQKEALRYIEYLRETGT